MMKNIALLTGSALLASFALVAQTTAQTPPADTASAASAQRPPDLTRGAKAWAQHCQRCHNLRSPSELNAELWNVSVTHMRVRANLPGDVARDIKAFLMFSADTKAARSMPAATGAAASASAIANLKPGDAEHGRVLYSQTCIACHGPDGKGAVEGVPDFTAADSRLFKADDVLLADAINGFQSEGSNLSMPPRGGNPNLSDQDIADILAYMQREFEPKR